MAQALQHPLSDTQQHSDKSFAQIRCDLLNADVGNKNKKDGYNCNKCKNKGIIYILEEDEAISTSCPECTAIRKGLFEIQKSGLGDYGFKNFTVSEKGNWQEKLLQGADEFARSDGDNWLYISGQCGAGKTHLCTAAVLNRIYLQGLEALPFKWVEASKKLKRFSNDGSTETELEKYKRIALLYIDDLFKTKTGDGVTSADINLAFDIIDYRYTHKLVTVISSEKSIDEIIAIDEALGGRIKQMAKKYAYHINKDRSKDYRLKDI